MRAAVDDRPLAMLNGARPDRSAMLAWAIGCSSAALAGILLAPTVGLSHVNLTLMIVNAYAAAMIGRLRSLPMTFVGAVLVGLLDAYALAYLPTDSVLLAQFRFAIPVIVLFVVLLALPQSPAAGPQHAHDPRDRSRGRRGSDRSRTAAVFVAAGRRRRPDRLGTRRRRRCRRSWRSPSSACRSCRSSGSPASCRCAR